MKVIHRSSLICCLQYLPTHTANGATLIPPILVPLVAVPSALRNMVLLNTPIAHDSVSKGDCCMAHEQIQDPAKIPSVRRPGYLTCQGVKSLKQCPFGLNVTSLNPLNCLLFAESHDGIATGDVASSQHLEAATPPELESTTEDRLGAAEAQLAFCQGAGISLEELEAITAGKLPVHTCIQTHTQPSPFPFTRGVRMAAAEPW